MITAALIAFAVLLVAWVLAPDRGEPAEEPAVLPLPETERIAA